MKIYFDNSDISGEFTSVYNLETDKALIDADVSSISIADINIIDLNNPDKRADNLSALIDDAPLFRINLEIIFDKLLFDRHENKVIEKALISGYAGKNIPDTLQVIEERTAYDMGGSLHHPMLAHIDSKDIAETYISCLTDLYELDNLIAVKYDIPEIIRKHSDRFFAFADGYIFGSTGRVSSKVLLKYNN